MKRNFLAAAVAAVLGLGFAATAQAGATVFGYTGNADTWTAPATGVYDITAWGPGSSVFGLGDEIGGDISLSQGQTLTILVGGLVGEAPGSYGGLPPEINSLLIYSGGGSQPLGVAGGGTTFVFSDTALLAEASTGGLFALSAGTPPSFFAGTPAVDLAEVNNGNGAVDIELVPEPATWAMLILGLAMIGCAVRREGKGVSASA